MHQQLTKPLHEKTVVDAIKEKEIMTGRIGHHFITSTNGVMRSVKLTLENGMLIANGKEILDLAQVSIMSVVKQ